MIYNNLTVSQQKKKKKGPPENCISITQDK